MSTSKATPPASQTRLPTLSLQISWPGHSLFHDTITARRPNAPTTTPAKQQKHYITTFVSANLETCHQKHTGSGHTTKSNFPRTLQGIPSPSQTSKCAEFAENDRTHLVSPHQLLSQKTITTTTITPPPPPLPPTPPPPSLP